ncbi:uncharacterized protein GGS22DRAFT_47775 [Annulohypoxylon maeteangense]|uniref:uncharacterized protein n=1 Tax=Annulohypoxylon maeteangense TaxID=1927788 RepID=UPI00200878BF|nr:uncharacterized protein GGS22DRAFT_47775 [Annulohypoxylon maeteangense]KAI0882100.1 hypothetical protein GGS22DRAFT_47775 [Annulohypoxylon maeteangense]
MTMSTAMKIPGGFFQVPEVSQAEIRSFHDAHFSNSAIELFDIQFLRPDNAQNEDQYYEEYEEYYEEEEDDGLGYYPDGVKRTLTDEQIAIFRHSELESLNRVEATAAKLKQQSAALLQAAKDEDASELHDESMATSQPVTQGENPEDTEVKKGDDAQDGSEDGEIEAEPPQLTKAEARRLKKQRSKRKKNQERKFNPEKKPDLRKRTWDVVEAGMDSLDYDELDTGRNASSTPAAQRRRISYDD